MTHRSYLVCSIAILLVAPILPASASDKAVQIFLGDEPVDLLEATPAILSNDVFVPIRPFAEALGASVDWDGTSRTLTVSGPTGIGVLSIGSRAAEIKGTKVYFPQAPYLYGGQFYGPILFFNEMFDQAWYWDPVMKDFKWIPIFPRYRGVGYPPKIIYGPGRRTPARQTVTVPATRIVIGEAARPLPSRTSPKITVRTAGKIITYPVARDAIILRGRIGGAATEVPLGNIRPGDAVTLRFNEAGTITSIKGRYKVVSGTVQSVAESTVLLETGQTLKATAGTEVILPDNIRGKLGDIRTGDAIAASISPITDEACVLKVLAGADKELPEEGEEDQISLNTTGPLRAGDALIVRFKAHVGGQARFTIPGVKADIAMTEIEPGVYQGEYTIQPGDILLRQPVSVNFIAATGESYSRLSRRPVTIETVPGYLPRIISPRQGQPIESPIVVQGLAEPGSLVRIIIEYRRNLQRLLPIEGVTAVEEVRANRDGLWETPPLAATAPFAEKYEDVPAEFEVFSDIFGFEKEPPIIYTITAISIGANGEERAAYRIEVTKKVGKILGGLVPPLVESKIYTAG